MATPVGRNDSTFEAYTLPLVSNRCRCPLGLDIYIQTRHNQILFPLFTVFDSTTVRYQTLYFSGGRSYTTCVWVCVLCVHHHTHYGWPTLNVRVADRAMCVFDGFRNSFVGALTGVSVRVCVCMTKHYLYWSEIFSIYTATVAASIAATVTMVRPPPLPKTRHTEEAFDGGTRDHISIIWLLFCCPPFNSHMHVCLVRCACIIQTHEHDKNHSQTHSEPTEKWKKKYSRIIHKHELNLFHCHNVH